MSPPIADVRAEARCRSGNSTWSTACSASPRSCRGSPNGRSTAPPPAPTPSSKEGWRDPWPSWPGIWPARSADEPRSTRESSMKEKIGVVGAGLMGAEIGLVFALAGHDVLLSDQSEAALSGALERLDRVLDRGIGRGFYKDEEKPTALARRA